MNHKKVMERVNELNEIYDFKPGDETRLNTIVRDKLLADKGYIELDKKNRLVAGRSSAFGALYESAIAYTEGHLVSGATIFTTLRKTQVFAEGLNLEENLKSYDNLLKDVECSDEENAKSITEAVTVIKEKVVPYLKDFVAQVEQHEAVKLAAMEKLLSSGSIRKKKKL